MKPTAAVLDAAPDLKVIDGIASWCGGLHGSTPLTDALRALAFGLGAEAAAISRWTKNDNVCRSVATWTTDGDEEVALRRSYSEVILGDYFNKLRTSSLWVQSHAECADAGFQTWLASSGMSDVAIVTLSATANETDYLELHFPGLIDRTHEVALEQIAPTITRAWSRRKPGLVTETHYGERHHRIGSSSQQKKVLPAEPILGFGNPARLSRVEFRVCLLLGRGLSVKGVQDEMCLKESTIRSHLRSIYAKTGVSGHAELVYRLLSTVSAAPEEGRKQA